MTLARVVALGAGLGDLLGGEAEDHDVLRADEFADLDVGAVERADGERAVEGELHVAGPRSLHARRRDLLGKVGGRDQHLGETDVVVGDEHHAQDVAHRRVRVDDAGDVVRQFDDELGVVIGRRRLAGEELHPRRPVPFRVRADLVVERHRLDDVEELALVLVDALDLDVEDRVRVEPQSHAVADEMREAVLVLALHLGEGVLEGRVVGVLLEVAERVDVVEEARADGVDEQVGQAGVALLEPAARGDAVGLVVDAVGEHAVEVLEDRHLEQVRVHRRDAVDRVRADEGEVAHPAPAARPTRRSG